MSNTGTDDGKREDGEVNETEREVAEAAAATGGDVDVAPASAGESGESGESGETAANPDDGEIEVGIEPGDDGTKFTIAGMGRLQSVLVFVIVVLVVDAIYFDGFIISMIAKLLSNLATAV
jgi:hypothetical protein